jgi:hypothetical protein
MPIKDQEAFWADVQSDYATDLQLKVADTLAKRMYEVESRKQEGSFQPMSYWIKQGYKPDLIKANTPAHMMQWNPQLGQCYKVVVTSESRETATEKARTQILEKSQRLPNKKRKRMSLLGPADDASDGMGAIGNGGREKKKKKKKHKKELRKVSSSTTSSSSGSSDEGADERASQKASRMAQQKMATAVAREACARNKKVRSTHCSANKVLTRCACVAASLDRDLNDSKCAMVPAVVMKNTRVAMKEITRCTEEANAKLNESFPVPYPEDYGATLTHNVQRWTETSTMLRGLLVAIRVVK